ncbi:beta strand repeat-containing protein, partial [Pelagibius sp. 7325]|uniref:beta strand repeat-containing protein n=1 Tax=Pelagibius sp. 7325 TaxID=3131994 RepID=UPI00345F7B3E
MALGPGSIAFTGFNADTTSNLAFAAMETIAAGTVIYFTANNWNGASFEGAEAVVAWTADADIPAGTVITLDGLQDAATASSSRGTLDFGGAAGLTFTDADEAVYAYTGASAETPAAFVAAIANDTFAAAGSTLDGTGLATGDTALALQSKDADADIAQYDLERSGHDSLDTFRTMINNPANWRTQDGSGDQSHDTGSPNLPFSEVPFVTEGLGTGAIAFTGFSSEGDGDLAFVTFEDIAAGTVISFTDNKWDGSSFASDESVWTWTADADIPAGSVISMNDLASGSPTSNHGTIAFTDSTNVGIDSVNEVIYAFTGTADAPTTFLTAFSNNQFSTLYGTSPGTGLTSGVNATAMGQSFVAPSNSEVAVYNRFTDGLDDLEKYRPYIYNERNWAYQKGDGDQSTDGVHPDLPFDTDPFTIIEGPQTQIVEFATDSLNVAATEGTIENVGYVDFTIYRTGGTQGNLSVTGTVTLGTADAGDFNNPTLTWGGTIIEGSTETVIRVSWNADAQLEADETFTITLTEAANTQAAVEFGDAIVAEGTILNDDDGKTDLVVTAGETLKGLVILSGADTLTVEEGGSIVADDEGPFTVGLVDSLNEVVIDNAGLISGNSENDSFDAIGGDLGVAEHYLTIINRETGVITSDQKAINVETDEDGGIGSILLENAGLIESTDDHAVDLRKAYSESMTVINHDTGRIIGNGDGLRGAFEDSTVDQSIVHNYGYIAGRDDGIDYQDGSATLYNYETGVIESFENNAISGDESQLIYNWGLITGGNGSGVNLDTSRNAPATVVYNYGTISGNYVGEGDGDGDGVDVDGLIEIYNEGRIEANGADNQDDFADGIAAGGGVIHNLAGGVIYGESRGILIDDSDLDEAYAATAVVNQGTITSDLDTAIRFIGSWNDKITNSGTIASASGSAIEMDGGNDNLTNSGQIDGDVDLGEGNDTLVNSKTITGAVTLGLGDDVLTQTGSGVIDGNVDAGDGTDTVTNSGSIEGGVALGLGDDRFKQMSSGSVSGAVDAGEGNDAVDASGSIDGGVELGAGDDSLILSSSGSVTGSVAAGDGDDELDIAGTIDGDVDLGLGDDSIAVKDGGLLSGDLSAGDGHDSVSASGEIDGDVDLGAGDDTLTLDTAATITGRIVGGEGGDTVVLTGKGDGSLGELADIETVQVEGGNWTLTGEGAEIVLAESVHSLTLGGEALADGVYEGSLTGFGMNDALRLAAIGTASSVEMDETNLLTIVYAGGTLTLQLDPAADYSSLAWDIAADGQGGSLLTLVPISTTPTTGDDHLVGTNGDDTLTGDRGDDTLDGGDGDDLLDGGRDDDVILAGDGFDTVYG